MGIENERTNPGKVHSFQKMKFRYNYSKRFLRDGNVLDVGCGNGYGAFLLNEFDYFGTDYFLDALEIAKGEFPKINFTQAKLPTLGLKDAKFDNVVCCEVIEHLPEEMGTPVLDECYRVLKKGGVLFLTTPNGDNREELMANHYIEYGSKQLQKMVKKAGFKITHVSGLSIPFIYGWKWYPPGLRRFYVSAAEEGPKRNIEQNSSFAKKSVLSVGKLGIKGLGVLMIYLGWLFPKRAEYQILVCEK